MFAQDDLPRTAHVMARILAFSAYSQSRGCATPSGARADLMFVRSRPAYIASAYLSLTLAKN